MRIDVLAIGSRGDVQPYVALGVGLRRAGHRVRLVTLGGFEDLVRRHDLDHLAVADSPKRIADTPQGRDWVKQRSNPAGFLRGFVRVAGALIEEGVANYWRACGDVEALIVSPMGLMVGEHVSEKLRIPLIQSQFAPPVLRTRYDWQGRKSLATVIQGHLKPVIHAAFFFLLWSKLRRITNAVRAKVLDLPPLTLSAVLERRRRETPLLAAYSPAVAPSLPDWDPWIHVTGYWFLDEFPQWNPSSELANFLDSGPRPVFIGFGSTPFPEPEKAAHMVVRAVEGAGQRGILVAGGTGLPIGQLSPQVLSVDSVPHSWLFPRVCAAVHHGGAGVTGAALRAGLPSVVVPVFADQPFWGNRVFQLGAGPRPIPAKLLRQENLQEAIRATGEKKMRQRAAELGQQIRAEDGVGNAVQIINKYLGKGAPQLAKPQHAH